MRLRRLLTIFALAAAIPAGGQAKFVFAPQWMAQAQFAGYYVAKDMGFYEEEGLDVEIRHPFSTQSLEDRVRTGDCQAYSMFLSEAMELVDKGIPMVNLLQTSMNSSLVIVSRYGADPLSMHNAKVIIWRAGFGQLAKCVAARESLDYQWITASSSINLFVSGAVDATLATTYNEYYQLLQTGLVSPDKGIFRFSEHGYNIQEDGVYMTMAEYRKNRDDAERFVQASRRGWEWAAEHPDETMEIVMKYVREFRIPTNEVLQRLMLDEVLRLQLDPDSGERAFRLRPDMVKQAGDMMLEAGIIKHRVTFESLLR